MLVPAAAAKKLKISPTGTVVPAKSVKGRIKKTVKPDFDGNGIGVLKDDKSVAVPFFRITYHKKGRAATESGSIDIPSRQVKSYQSITTELTGVTEKALQKLTDTVYEDLVGKLAEAGYTVVPAADVAAAPTFKELKSKYPDAGASKSVYTQTGGKYPGVMSIGLKSGKLMQQVDAALVIVDLHVYCVSIGTDNESGIGIAKASISVGQVAHVRGTWSVMSRVDAKCREGRGCAPKHSGNVTLQQTPYSTVAFGTLVNRNSAGTKIGNTVSAVGTLLGGSSARSRQNYILEADEAKFVEAAGDALAQANDWLLKAIRQ
jgi:hypothetical protein